MGRWVIANGNHQDLAWSGSRWVPHRNGWPTSDLQICNFETREDAQTYVEEHLNVIERG